MTPKLPPPRPRLPGFPPEDVRHRVDKIMETWQSFASFAELLDAQMWANVMSNAELARRLSAHSGRSISWGTVRTYRKGERPPPYSFIEALVESNALQLDPERIHPAEAGRTAGDQRIAMFAAAGLIEVTPESIGE